MPTSLKHLNFEFKFIFTIWNYEQISGLGYPSVFGQSSEKWQESSIIFLSQVKCMQASTDGDYEKSCLNKVAVFPFLLPTANGTRVGGELPINSLAAVCQKQQLKHPFRTATSACTKNDKTIQIKWLHWEP